MMPPPQMNWNQNAADERRFRIISTACVLLGLLLGVILNRVDAPAPEFRSTAIVPPHLAQIVMERKKVEPPKVVELPKPVEPEKLKPEDIKPEPKPEEKPQPKPVETKPEPVVEAKPQEQPQPQVEAPRKNVEAARKKAAGSGVLAMRDMLADLREAAPAETIQQSTQQLQTGGSEERTTTRSLLTAKAGKGSGGIDTSKFSRDTGGGGALAGHETAAVTSRLDTLPAAKAQKREEEKQAAEENAGRSQAEISRIIEANRAAIYIIYQRALRQNPSMQGKVVFKITIAPSGEVSECTVESSDLGDGELERKLALRIKRIDFGAKNVDVTSITYPINFLPNL
jgi:TonB family protein